MSMKALVLGTAVAVLATALALPVSAQMYRWVDERGTVHYSEGIDSIPERHRPRAQPLPYQKLPPAPATTEKEASPKGGARIAYKPGEQIFVNAMINGKGPVKLLLDTGADTTLISPLALWKVGVSSMYAPRGEIQGVTGRTVVGAVKVESVEIGEARVGPMTVVAHDAEIRDADGLLGRDFLNHFTVTVDPKAGVVTLVPK